MGLGRRASRARHRGTHDPSPPRRPARHRKSGPRPRVREAAARGATGERRRIRWWGQWGRRRTGRPVELRAPGRASDFRADGPWLRAFRRAAHRPPVRAAGTGAGGSRVGLDGPRLARHAGDGHRPVVGRGPRAGPALRVRDPRAAGDGRRPGSVALRRRRRHPARPRNGVLVRDPERQPHRAPGSDTDGHDHRRRLLGFRRGHPARRFHRHPGEQPGLHAEPGRHARLPHLRIQRAAARQLLDPTRLPGLPADAGRHARPRRPLSRRRQLGRRERLQHRRRRSSGP